MRQDMYTYHANAPEFLFLNMLIQLLPKYIARQDSMPSMPMFKQRNKDKQLSLLASPRLQCTFKKHLESYASEKLSIFLVYCSDVRRLPLHLAGPMIGGTGSKQKRFKSNQESWHNKSKYNNLLYCTVQGVLFLAQSTCPWIWRIYTVQ